MYEFRTGQQYQVGGNTILIEEINLFNVTYTINGITVNGTIQNQSDDWDCWQTIQTAVGLVDSRDSVA